MHENDHQHRLRGFKLIISMSFGESIFLAWLFQKTVKGDQNVKLNCACPRRKLLQKVAEDTKSHVTEADPEGMIGGADWPHL